MGSQLLLVLTALLFFVLGYHAGHYTDSAKDLIKKTKRIINRPKGIIIDYPTAEEQEYRGSEQEKIDMEQEKLMRNAGIVK